MTPNDSDLPALLSGSSADGLALLAAAQADWTRPIIHCPGWDAAELTRHMGSIFGWMAAIVGSGRRIRRSELGPGPEDPADLPRWYTDALDRASATLAAADPDAAIWTFAAPLPGLGSEATVTWWFRRLAVEVAVHRWDAQYALAPSGALPLDGDVAAAGIEELLIDFLPGMVERSGGAAWSGTLHLHATDGPSEWLVDLGAGGVATPGHAKAETAIRATRSDLLLWLHNRTPAATLEVFGDRSALDAWRLLAR